jgi:hypothetical protein
VIASVRDQKVKDAASFRDAIDAANLKKGVRMDVFTGTARRSVFLHSENPS